jgi:hypothetical protein
MPWRIGGPADTRQAHAVSALPPKADKCGAKTDVCYGPIADIKPHEEQELASSQTGQTLGTTRRCSVGALLAAAGG